MSYREPYPGDVPSDAIETARKCPHCKTDMPETFGRRGVGPPRRCLPEVDECAIAEPHLHQECTDCGAKWVCDRSGLKWPCARAKQRKENEMVVRAQPRPAWVIGLVLAVLANIAQWFLSRGGR